MPGPPRFRPLLFKFIGYVATGGTAAVVDLGLFVLLHPVVGSVLAAASISFLTAAVWNYATSARFVFREPLSWRGWGRFLAAAAVGLAVNVGVTWTYATLAGGEPAYAKITGIGVAFLLNFVLNVTLVFGRRKTS